MAKQTELAAPNGVPKTLPTLAELVSDTEMSLKQNAFMVLCNQEPPKQWVMEHPIAKVEIIVNESKVKVPAKYLPIERVEYLLSRIFTRWWVDIKEVKILANSVTVIVRVWVVNPVTGVTEFNDGLGAVAIQTDAGKGATDFNFVKSSGVQIASPAAESYAIKDAAEKWGKLFGKDLNRKDEIFYDSLLKDLNKIDVEDLRELFEMKRDVLSADEITHGERILNNKEVNSYSKLYQSLKSK